MNLLNNINGKSSTKSIQNQLFDQILIVVFCVSIVNIVGNIIISFPLQANIKWIGMILLTIIINRFKDESIWVKYLFLVFIILFIIPLGWYNSGANSNNVVAYIFLVTIGVCFLFNGFYRLSLILMIIGTFVSFLLLEYFIPELLPRYNPSLQFFDRLIQIPLIILVTFFMLRQFANTFYEKNDLLNHLNKQLELIAYQDDLTLVNNRTFIFERYQEAINRKKNFITLMIDLDDFKQINDEYGHLEGDQILRDLADTLKSQFGDYGHIARYGGDEFILLLFMDVEALEFKIHSFLDAYQNLEIIRRIEANLSGCYTLYDSSEALDRHLRVLDKGLLDVKNSGKNKIVYVGKD